MRSMLFLAIMFCIGATGHVIATAALPSFDAMSLWCGMALSGLVAILTVFHTEGGR